MPLSITEEIIPSVYSNGKKNWFAFSVCKTTFSVCKTIGFIFTDINEITDERNLPTDCFRP